MVITRTKKLAYGLSFVVGVSVVSLTAIAVTSFNKDGNTLEMVQSDLIQLRFLRNSEVADFFSQESQKLPPRDATPTRPPLLQEPASPDEIKARLGSVLVPTHLPEGYVLHRGSLSSNGTVLLFFKKPKASLPYIGITQNLSKDTQIVLEGSTRAITVDGNPGYLLRGGWLEVRHKGDQEGPPVWDQEAPTFWDLEVALTVGFELDGKVIRLRASPATAVSEEELIRIAESLQPY